MHTYTLQKVEGDAEVDYRNVVARTPKTSVACYSQQLSSSHLEIILVGVFNLVTFIVP
jgi:hypothetical protein